MDLIAELADSILRLINAKSEPPTKEEVTNTIRAWMLYAGFSAEERMRMQGVWEAHVTRVKDGAYLANNPGSTDGYLNP